MSGELRVAFVGQEAYFSSCALDRPAGGVIPTFVDHRAGADPAPLLSALHQLAPDVVVVFRPEIIPPGALASLDALTLGFTTEPLPRDVGAALPHPDLVTRLGELAGADPTQFDRVVAFDPLSAPAAAQVGIDVWRSLPLPVADRVYGTAPVHAAPRPRIAFIGYSTAHRERFLVDAKHHHDVLHVASGLFGDRLLEQFGRTDVAINLHGEPYPTFENRVCLHLAAGHLVLSEPLSPTHGLEPGIDFLEFTTPEGLLRLVDGIHARPDVFRAVRLRGRRKAEQFRASRVWPRLLADLRADVEAFGSARVRA